MLKRFARGRLDISKSDLGRNLVAANDGCANAPKIVVCGIDNARRQIDELRELDLKCIILDECHRIKNPHSKTTIAMESFKCLRRFGLTVPNLIFIAIRDFSKV